jgi:hypothetical protein
VGGDLDALGGVQDGAHRAVADDTRLDTDLARVAADRDARRVGAGAGFGSPGQGVVLLSGMPHGAGAWGPW